MVVTRVSYRYHTVVMIPSGGSWNVFFNLWVLVRAAGLGLYK